MSMTQRLKALFHNLTLDLATVGPPSHLKSFLIKACGMLRTLIGGICFENFGDGAKTSPDNTRVARSLTGFSASSLHGESATLARYQIRKGRNARDFDTISMQLTPPEEFIL